MGGLTFIGSYSQADIASIGLVFESNFFTAYFYSDLDARYLVAYKVLNTSEELFSEELKEIKPIFAITFNGSYTLVPQQVFNDEDAGKFLSFNTQAIAENADWNRIIGLDSVLIYEADKKSEKIVDAIFPGLRLKHGVGAMLEFCRRNKSKATHAFLHQSGTTFNFAIFNNSGLQFANSIDASHPEDVRYFMLYTLKTLELPNTVWTNLLGASAKNEEVINLLKPYLPNLKITIENLGISENDSKTSLSPEFSTTYWAGVYASLCA